jgi:hypothetical protein
MNHCVGIVVGEDSLSAVVAGTDPAVSAPDRVSVPAFLVIAPGVGRTGGSSGRAVRRVGGRCGVS